MIRSRHRRRSAAVAAAAACACFFAAAPLGALSVEPDKVVEKAPVFLGAYQAGLLFFENRTALTNHDYLSVSLPLMLKEELKKLPEFFIERAQLLLENENVDWDRPWYALRPFRLDDARPSLGPDGKPFTTRAAEDPVAAARRAAPLRKKLAFQSDVVIRHDQTLDEVARERKCHFLLGGEFTQAADGKITVSAWLYDAVRGRVVRRFERAFPPTRVLLDLPVWAGELRAAIANFPVASLRVESAPADAMVYLDGVFVGRTPLDLDAVTATNHRLFMKKDGFAAAHEEVLLAAGKPWVWSRTLSVEAKNGSLSVVSSPTGATVLLDLVPHGRTPCVLSNLPAADYRLELTLDGYQVRRQRVRIEHGKTVRAELTLRPEIPGALTQEQKAERVRWWMNTSLWTGGISLLGYAWLYFQYEDNKNEYYALYAAGGREADAASALSRANNYHRWANGALGLTIGAISVSACLLVTYLLVDQDKELGLAPQGQPDFMVYASPTGAALAWRF